jgi:hypothetical protein
MFPAKDFCMSYEIRCPRKCLLLEQRNAGRNRLGFRRECQLLANNRKQVAVERKYEIRKFLPQQKSGA